MKHSNKEAKEMIAELREENPNENFDRLEDPLTKGFDMRDAFFDVAGIDPSIVTKIIEKVESKDFTADDISALIAPELRKAFNVDFDTENAEPGEVKFKKSDKANLLDELGINNEKTAELLTLFTKCYNEDKEPDWIKLNSVLLSYMDKFFAPAYKNAEEAGLLIDEDNKGEES